MKVDIKYTSLHTYYTLYTYMLLNAKSEYFFMFMSTCFSMQRLSTSSCSRVYAFWKIFNICVRLIFYVHTFAMVLMLKLNVLSELTSMYLFHIAQVAKKGSHVQILWQIDQYISSPLDYHCKFLIQISVNFDENLKRVKDSIGKVHFRWTAC